MGKSGGFNLDVPYSSRLQQQQQHASSIGSGGPPPIGPLLLPPRLPQSLFLFTWVQSLLVPPWSLTTAPGILKWVFPVTWSRASLPRQSVLPTSRFWIEIGAPPIQAIRLFTARFLIGMKTHALSRLRMTHGATTSRNILTLRVWEALAAQFTSNYAWPPFGPRVLYLFILFIYLFRYLQF